MPGIILMCDPCVAAIPVRECGERLRDVRYSRLLVDRSRQDAEGAFAHVREGVLERLQRAQSALPDGVRLLLVEGYRPPVLQEQYFERYVAWLRAANPQWSGTQVHRAASRFVAPPEIAPHTAGAAVDITLADANGHELDLGTGTNATPEESDGACYMDAKNISAKARYHRRILAHALAGAGLVNYETEWWHWSYGDRYWAMKTGSPTALYGPCSLPAQQGYP
ncbi:M15 family metallopeptidase [Streptomyces sp. VNUA116]|uniref:M15 family metallopeptidase n=1 Tax=Streptomyces sp. VNUA116 TaxID=3062449 RepID=UPI002675DF9B|nr:M15 family metallopeptidase [Streptomyces sp. VNUA116]WKU42823.1 M15 family metallopeptidase [Streptomyces sp. VNUA116]